MKESSVPVYRVLAVLISIGLMVSLSIALYAERTAKNNCVQSFKETLEAQQLVLNSSRNACEEKGQRLLIKTVSTKNGIADIQVECGMCVGNTR